MSATAKKESVFDKISKEVDANASADSNTKPAETSARSAEEDLVREVVISAYTADRIMITQATVDKTTDHLLRLVRLACVRIGMSEAEFLQKHRNFFMGQNKGKKTAAAMYSNRNTYSRLLTRTDGDANEITYTNAKRILQDIYGLRINHITMNFTAPALGRDFEISSAENYTDMVTALEEDNKLSSGIDADALSKAN